MKKCLVSSCETKATTRGLCPNCYQSALAMVRKGTTTWAELEHLKLASPPQRGNQMVKFLGEFEKAKARKANK